MNDLDRIYRRSSNVVFRGILDEHILVPIRGQVADMQKVYTLNAVGAFLWNALDGGRSLRDIAGDVHARYQVDAARAEADVIRFANELRDAGLIESVA